MKRIRETIEVAEPLWRALEQMSHDLGVDRDALVAQALFLLAKQNGYVAPTPVLLGATSAVAQAIPTEAPVPPRPPALEPRASEPAVRAVEPVAAVSPPVKEPAAPSVAVGAQEPAKAEAPVSDDAAFVRNRMKEVLASVDATVLPREVAVPSEEAESEQEADDEEPSDDDESDGNDVASDDDDEESEEDEEESDDEDAPEEDAAEGDIAAALAEASEDTDEASEGAEDSEEEQRVDAEDDSIAAAVGAEADEDSDEDAADDAGSEDDSAEQDDSAAPDEPAEPEPAQDKEEPEEPTDSGKRVESTNITQAPQPLELFVRLAPGGPAVMVDVPRFTLGRGPNCSLTVKSGRVSREHAAIVRVGDDFFIEDLDSSNGTWINHQRIKRQKIEDGDTFNLGTEAVYFSMGPRED